MRATITGKDIDLGNALQSYVSDKLADGVHKYFGRPADAKVTFSKEGHLIRANCSVHLSSGIHLAATGEGGDAYAGFDDALQKIEKRVRRYKRRLKDHHNEAKAPLPAEEVSSYVVAPFDDDESEPADETGAAADPVIVAEATENIREMTAGTAVMQLDLADQAVLVFKNAAHGRVNIVYRRADGNIGWIDPKN